MREESKPVIDEKTRFSLTYNNIWALVLVVVSFVGLYFGLDKRLTRIEDKLDTVTVWTKEHKEETTILSERMRAITTARNEEISEIKQTIAAIKTLLKINP